MRARRDTNVSILPVSSSSSTSIISSPTASARDSISEDLLELGSKEALMLGTDSKIHRSISSRSAARTYAFLSFFSILLFILYNTLHQRCISFTQINLFNTASQQAKLLQPLPQGPAAVTFIDSEGYQRWTVSLPAGHTLTSSQSKAISQQARQYDRAMSLQDLVWTDEDSSKAGRYTYMDVDEAQALQILPAPANSTQHACQKSLTYVIDPTETSFGKTLLTIWLSYGIAKRDGRAFFLDDSKWAYGSYLSLFSPLPDPGCQRPDLSQIVPYPSRAKHLVIRPNTIQHLFPDVFSTLTFQWPQLHNINNPQVFDLLRVGYEDLFSLIDEDADYARNRVNELKAKTEGAMIGMHIRRGDLRPLERQFSGDYLPAEKYTNAAKAILSKLENGRRSLVLASDDPDLINSPDLIEASSPYDLIKSQERIQLATKAALDKSAPAKSIRQPGSAYVKHVDENAGWDGGFYPAMFLALGGAGRGQAIDSAVSEQTLQMRQLIARGYLLDLAVLSKTDGLTCAVSSATCRLLGVMMGKDAVQSGKWVNVDDRRKWSWNGLA